MVRGRGTRGLITFRSIVVLAWLQGISRESTTKERCNKNKSLI